MINFVASYICRFFWLIEKCYVEQEKKCNNAEKHDLQHVLRQMPHITFLSLSKKYCIKIKKYDYSIFQNSIFAVSKYFVSQRITNKL